MKDLHGQLVEHRDDLALWTVYGDQLQAENDLDECRPSNRYFTDVLRAAAAAVKLQV